MYYDVLRCITCALCKTVCFQWCSWSMAYLCVFDVSYTWCIMVCCLWKVKYLSDFSEIHPILPLTLHFQSGFQQCAWKFLIASSSILPFIPGERCFNCAIDLKVRRALHSLIYTLMIFDALFVKQYKHSAHSHDISIHQCCFPVPSESKHQRFGEIRGAAASSMVLSMVQAFISFPNASTGFNRLRLQAFFGWMMRWFRAPPGVQFCVAVWGLEYYQIYPDITIVLHSTTDITGRLPKQHWLNMTSTYVDPSGFPLAGLASRATCCS